MDVPLGKTVGNAVEVIESIDVLKGKGPKDLEDLSVLFAARMLVLAGIETEEAAALARVRAALASGAGVEAFRRIIENQGGDPRVVDDYSRLPSAPDAVTIDATRSGFVTALHAEAVGRAAVALGAGRARIEDAVDHGVAIEVVATAGDRVSAGDPILLVRHRGGRGLGEALPLLNGAIEIGDVPPAPQPLVVERVTEDR
jgi:thymidine phosphorylase